MKSFKVKVTDNSPKVLSELEHDIMLGLNAIGNRAEEYTKKGCTVDTGRLRNSITYATTDKHSEANTSPGAEAQPKDFALKAQPQNHAVHIGTNVEYAPAVEFRDMEHNTGKAHFLKDAISTHSDEYKRLMEAALKK